MSTADPEWRSVYEKHIHSARWRNIRKDMFRLRNNKCERCDQSSATLELHHKTYERLGRELISDLEVLCGACHEIADRERAIQGQMRAATALHNAAFHTFAAKKYGEDWQLHHGEDVADEFDEWLERKREDER